MIEIFVPGHPIAKQSFRYSKTHGYTNPIVKDWADTVGYCAKTYMQNHNKEVLEKDIAVVLVFFLPARRKVDCDNLSKNVLDALNGICYKDDSLIRRLTIVKDYVKENPGVAITIDAVEE